MVQHKPHWLICGGDFLMIQWNLHNLGNFNTKHKNLSSKLQECFKKNHADLKGPTHALQTSRKAALQIAKAKYCTQSVRRVVLRISVWKC